MKTITPSSYHPFRCYDKRTSNIGTNEINEW